MRPLRAKDLFVSKFIIYNASIKLAPTETMQHHLLTLVRFYGGHHINPHAPLSERIPAMFLNLDLAAIVPR